MITALAGKAAGVQVSKNSSGMGGSAKVSIRGVRSVVGDNQPLYVMDGVPMLNSTSEQAYSCLLYTSTPEVFYEKRSVPAFLEEDADRCHPCIYPSLLLENFYTRFDYKPVYNGPV